MIEKRKNYAFKLLPSVVEEARGRIAAEGSNLNHWVEERLREVGSGEGLYTKLDRIEKLVTKKRKVKA
jgi:hypothetical protein